MHLLKPFLPGFIGLPNDQPIARCTIAGVLGQQEHLELLAVLRPMPLRLRIKYCLYQPSVFQCLTLVVITFAQNLDYGHRLVMFSCSILIYSRETLERLYHYHLGLTINIVGRQSENSVTGLQIESWMSDSSKSRLQRQEAACIRISHPLAIAFSLR